MGVPDLKLMLLLTCMFAGHTVPQVDRITEMSRSPEIACLRSPDILSSPNRCEF
jgi:hypothetical protein